MMVVVTGGIGCGKSEVAHILRELGLNVLDLDHIVHELHTRPAVRAAVAGLLGLAADYTRADVANVVFQDTSRLRALEALLHPLVWQEVEARRGVVGDVVLEMPLPPRVGPGDRVICVEAPLALRVQRLRARGLSADEVTARLAAAPDAAEYRRHASVVIQNDGDLEALRQQVLVAWEAVQHGEG